MAAVMTQAEADKLFDQMDNENTSGVVLDLDGPIPMPDQFEAGKLDTVYPGGLPGKLVRIYDTKTGYVSTVLPYMLKNVMKMTHKDGSPRFSRTQNVKPAEGSSWCFLNKNHPDNAQVREMGIVAQCSKPVPLLSVVHAERHAETRHSDNWKAYQRMLQERRDDEQREFQRLQLEVLRMQVAGNAGTAAPTVFACRMDGCARFFDTDDGRKIHESKPHN